MSDTKEPKDLTRRADTAIDVPEVINVSAMSAQAKGEIEAQIDVARKYPRSIKRFLDDAISMVTLTPEVAQSCIYALPRAGKTLKGPSIRMAEIVASAWGNLHCAARPFEVGETDVTAQAVVIDLQRNVKISIEAKRRITSKDGKRYNDDMILMTEAAAQSIALRNAILRVVPRAFTEQVYEAALKVATGDAKTLVERRDGAMAALAKMGATQVRVLAALKKPSVEDIDVSDLETLFGYFNAIKHGEAAVDEVFPEPAKPAADLPTTGAGGRMTLDVKAAAKEAEPATTATEPPAEAAAPTTTGSAPAETPAPLALETQGDTAKGKRGK